MASDALSRTEHGALQYRAFLGGQEELLCAFFDRDVSVFLIFLSACTLFVQLKIFFLAFQPLNQRQLQGACFVRVQAALLLIPDAERARSRQSP